MTLLLQYIKQFFATTRVVALPNNALQQRLVSLQKTNINYFKVRTHFFFMATIIQQQQRISQQLVFFATKKIQSLLKLVAKNKFSCIFRWDFRILFFQFHEISIFHHYYIIFSPFKFLNYKSIFCLSSSIVKVSLLF